MAWFRVDDKLWGHQKWVAASLSARGLWVTAGAWAADHLTDGQVPNHIIPILGARTKDAQELVGCGLWRPDGTGWRFIDWTDYQPTREQVEAERQAARDRQTRARQAARERREQQANITGSHAVTHTEVHPVVTGPPTRPDPTRPVVPTELLKDKRSPAESERARLKSAQRIPAEFTITTEMRKWAAEKTPHIDVDAATEHFIDHWKADATPKARKLDWNAAWREWMRREPPRRITATPPGTRNAATERINEDLEKIRNIQAAERNGFAQRAIGAAQ